MHKKLFVGFAIAIALICAAVVFGAAPPGAPTDKHPEAYKGLTPDGIAKIKKGEILILKNIEAGASPSGMIEAAIIFNQPIDKVWELLVTKCDEQNKFLPYLEKSTLLKKEGNHMFIDFYLKIMNVGMDYRVDHIIEKDKYYFHWALDPSYKNKLKTLKGYWRFYYIDDTHTLARYGTWFEIGIGVPEFVQSFLIKRDLPESLNNVKKFVDSGGKWRKPGYTGKD